MQDFVRILFQGSSPRSVRRLPLARPVRVPRGSRDGLQVVWRGDRRHHDHRQVRPPAMDGGENAGAPGAAPRAGPRRSSPGPRGGRTRNASAPRFRRRTRATSREPSDRRKNPPTHHPTRRWRANRPNRPQGPRSVRAPHPPERSRKPAPSATRCIPHDVRPSVRPRLGGVLASSLLTQFPFDGEQIRKQPSTPPFVRSEQAPFVEQ